MVTSQRGKRCSRPLCLIERSSPSIGGSIVGPVNFLPCAVGVHFSAAGTVSPLSRCVGTSWNGSSDLAAVSPANGGGQIQATRRQAALLWLPRTCPIWGYCGVLIKVGHPSRWDVLRLQCDSGERDRLAQLWARSIGALTTCGASVSCNFHLKKW